MTEYPENRHPIKIRKIQLFKNVMLNPNSLTTFFVALWCKLNNYINENFVISKRIFTTAFGFAIFAVVAESYRIV